MVDHTFYCGNDPPVRWPKNSHVLSTRGPGRNIELDRLRINRKLLSSIPLRLLDLIDIASFVFAADRTTRRGGNIGQGMGKDWRRNLRFRIAVRDPAHWSQPELMLALGDVLGFMSEDSFQFEFVNLAQAPDDLAYFDFGNSPAQDGPSAPVVLFSGGLDSLAGALEELSSGSKQVALVTHLSSDMMTPDYAP